MSTGSVGELLVKISANSSPLNSGMDAAERRINTFGSRATAGITKTAAGMVKAFAVVGSGVAAVAAGLIAVGTKAVMAAGQMEQVQVAFTTMIGSADRANKLMQDLQKFAATTPFEFTEIQGAAKQLLAFGTSAEDMTAVLRRLGDIASGVGIPLSQIADIYGRVQVQGKLTGETLQRFSENGVPLIKALAKQFNIAEGDVVDFVSKGKVGFADVQKAIASMTDKGGQFGGMMENQSKTFLGALSNLKDAVGQAGAKIGDSLTKALDLTGIVANLSESLGKIGPGVAAANGDFSKIGKVIGDALMEGVGSLLDILPKALEAGIAVVESLLTGILEKAPELADAALNLLFKLVDMLIRNLPKVLKVGVEIITKLLKGIASYMPTLVKGVMEIVDTILEVLTSNGPDLIDAAVQIITSLVDGIADHIDKIIPAALTMITTLVAALLNNVDDLTNCALDLILAIVNGLSKQENLDKLTAAAESIINALNTAILGMDHGIATFCMNLIDAIVAFYEAPGNAERAGAAGLKIGAAILQGMKDYMFNNLQFLYGDVYAKWLGIKNPVTTNPTLTGGADTRSHAAGLSYVPYDGYPAILHKGERVLTAREAARGAVAGAGGMAVTININGYNGDSASLSQQIAREIKRMSGSF